MNILVGDSRAKGLGSYYQLRGNLEVWAKSGAGIRAIEGMVNDHFIMYHGGQPLFTEKTHYYISAGICDMTKRIQSKPQQYEEVTYMDAPSETLHKMTSQLKKIQTQVLNLGATPIFTTIYSLDLATWNNIRLNQRKTSVLNYESDYNSMQIALNEAISLVNDAIITLNKNMMVATPMIHKCLLHNVRKGIKHWQYHKLVDGCHPNEPIKEDIANSLNRAIQLNRNL